MELEIINHDIDNMVFGDSTVLSGKELAIDHDELKEYLLEDRRLQDIDIQIAKPGESCRIGVVFDIIEPRAKETGSGSDFPGLLGPFAVAGQGSTHVLRGSAVTVIDPSAVPGITSKVLEMQGEPASASPYGNLHHLVLSPKVLDDSPRHVVQNVLRMLSVKAAVYLGNAAQGKKSDQVEIYSHNENDNESREGIPRIAYIAQIHGHQMTVEEDEPILYGSNTEGMMPILLNPNEILDGALVASYWVMRVETYFYQNHPLIKELLSRHQSKEITFTGVIATVAASKETDRNRNCMLAASMAKSTLKADGVVLTKYGGGAPHVDMGETARLCEAMGMPTVVQVSDSSGDRKAESAMLFNYPEVDAVVYGGGGDTGWDVGTPERVIAGTPGVAKTLQDMKYIEGAALCGITNQQGASKIRATVY